MQTANFINFVGLNLATAISSFLIVLWLTHYRVRSFFKLFLSLFIIFCSQIIIVEILLGALSMLSYKNICIAIYLIFFVAIFLLGRNTLKNFKIEKAERDYPDLFSILILFSPIIFLLFAKAFNAALQIPLEYDSIAYHLPFVSKWLQTGTLNDLYYSAFAGPISYYPSNYELLDLWTFLPFKNDFFANLINFPLFAILVIVIWRILRNFGIGKNTALISMAIPFYMPIFLHQAGLPLVDLFFVLLFAISIFFLQEISLHREKDKNYSDFFLFGLSIGLFIGTKYLGLVYGAPLILLLAGIAFYQAKNKKIKLSKAGFITIVGILFTGSFFYIRNWIDSGNPLFPVDLNLFGLKILDGYKGAGVNEMLTNTSLWTNLNTFSEVKGKIISFFYITGPYGLISIVLPAVIVIYLICNFLYGRIIKKIFIKSESLTLLLLGIALLAYFYLYLKAPYTHRDFFPNIRYAMPFLLLGVLGTATIIQKLSFLKPLFYLLTIFNFVGSFLFLIFSPPEQISYTDRIFLNYSILLEYKVPLLILSISLIAFLYALRIVLSSIRNKNLKYRVICCLLLFASLIGTFKFIKFASDEREKLREYWTSSYFGEDQTLIDIISASEWFNKNAPDAKIAYSGFNFHYYLYGRNLNREVDYVNINECTYCKYVDYKNSENSIRRDPHYQNWLENLGKMGKDYLIVNPLSTKGVRSYEFEWANENPDNFKKTFSANDVYVYKISYD